MMRDRCDRNFIRLRILADAGLLVLIILLSSMTEFTRGLPPGFISEIVSDIGAVSGTFATNPKTGEPLLLLVSKNGRVRALEDPERSSKDRLILDLEDKICTNGERGLQNIAIHPNFIKNHFVYLFYTKFKEGCLEDKTEPRENHPYNVVARFTMDQETLMLDYDSREEIWRGWNLKGYAVHNGGAMAFGNDGKLYVTHGDAGVQDNAQTLRNVFGTLVRLNDDGSTPEDNPFTETNGYDAHDCRETEGKVPSNATSMAVCSEIYAFGFRNPFRIAIDSNEKEKVRFSIQDVGARTWEELSHGGTDYAGKNYGWKLYEGTCLRHSSQECPISEDPDILEPFYSYLHRSDGSGCVSGAAFVPKGIWPEEYTFLFADFTYYELYSLTEEPGNECRSCMPPIPRFQNKTFFETIRIPGEGKNQGRIVNMFFGPYKDTQALYVITYGNIETVHRIHYTGIHNDLPFVNFTVSKQDVDVNEKIQFDSSGSYDPEGEDVSFQWFFGDGTKSTESNPTHNYNGPGKYKVTLFVGDVLNQMQQKSTTIFVGEPPEAEILSPAEADQFYVGQVIRLEGKANYLNGTAFNDSHLQWEVRKHHDDHYHPFLDLTFGNHIDLSPAPEPEDFYASTNSYLEVILYATDDNGLTRKICRNIQPLLVDVRIDSNKIGLNIDVNDERVSTSSNVVSWKDQHLYLKARSDSSYRFVSWSDGVEEESRSVVVNSSDPIYTANFCALNGSLCSDQVVCCSGYCVRDMMEKTSYRSNSDQTGSQISESSMVCIENLPSTGSPTGPTTRAKTVTPHSAPISISTSVPTSSPNFIDKISISPGATIIENDENSSNASLPAAKTVMYIDSFLFTVSFAFLIYMNV